MKLVLSFLFHLHQLSTRSDDASFDKDESPFPHGTSFSTVESGPR
jgi:hypothetical protein